MEPLTTRFLIEEYMMGSDNVQRLAGYFLTEIGGWMFEDGASDEYYR